VALVVVVVVVVAVVVSSLSVCGMKQSVQEAEDGQSVAHRKTVHGSDALPAPRIKYSR